MNNLKTYTLNLRKVRLSDAPFILENLRDPAIRNAHLGMPFPLTLQKVRRQIALWKKFKDQDAIVLVNGKPAGIIGLAYHPTTAPNLSYWLAKEYRGQGIGKESVALFLQCVSFTKIEARPSPYNIPSQKLLLSLGFQKKNNLYVLEKSLAPRQVIL
jgi:RimJ/RimL family protein N-acetyltransferase